MGNKKNLLVVNMKVKGKLKYIYLFFFFLNPLIFSMTWEVGFRVMNSNNSAMIATISVYKFNYITRDLDYYIMIADLQKIRLQVSVIITLMVHLI